MTSRSEGGKETCSPHEINKRNAQHMEPIHLKDMLQPFLQRATVLSFCEEVIVSAELVSKSRCFSKANPWLSKATLRTTGVSPWVKAFSTESERKLLRSNVKRTTLEHGSSAQCSWGVSSSISCGVDSEMPETNFARWNQGVGGGEFATNSAISSGD